MTTKRVLLMLLVMLMSVTGAWADFNPSWTRNWFTIRNVQWSNSINDAETADKMFDGNNGTKWLAKTPDVAPEQFDEYEIEELFAAQNFQDAWTSFEVSIPVKVIAYALTTGSDTYYYPERNPKTWKFQGSNDNVNWTNLDEHTDDGTMEEANSKSYTFPIPSDKQANYRYYRLVVSYTVGNVSIRHDDETDGHPIDFNAMIQIAELSLTVACPNHVDADGDKICDTCGEACYSFISAVKISAEEGQETNKQRLRDEGYTVIDQDLNQDAGGRYIYIGYKTTTNPAEAISGLIIMESGNGVDVRKSTYKTNPITYQGKNYYRCDSYGSNDDNCDLNRKAGGSDITLYYTKDGNTDHGATLLTELTAVVNNKNMAGYSYIRHWQYGTDMYSTSDTDVYGDANKGTGDDPIYFPCKYHTLNYTATFHWANDGSRCTADVSCGCGIKSTNVRCDITTGATVVPTCTTDGYTPRTATVNLYGKEFSDTKNFNIIGKSGHAMTHHDRVEATYTHDGNYEYWTCSRACCAGIYYKNAEGTERYSEYPVIPLIRRFTLTLDKQGGTGGDDQVTFDEGAEMPTITVPTRTDYAFQGYYIEKNGQGTQYYNADGTSTQEWNLTENKTLYAYWVWCVDYVDMEVNTDAEGNVTVTPVARKAVDVTEITNETTSLPAGWYMVKESNVQTGTLTCNGEVHLILADDAKLTATGGIRVSGDGKSLTIYGQTNQSGKLIANGENWAAGIGGGYRGDGKNITINGGIVEAHGGNNAAGIGGGERGNASNITINNGRVTAIGADDCYGIGSGMDDNNSASGIHINGGIVKTGNKEHGHAIGARNMWNIYINPRLVLQVTDDDGYEYFVVFSDIDGQELCYILKYNYFATIRPKATVVANYAPNMEANFGTFYSSDKAYEVISGGVTMYTASVETSSTETYLTLHEIGGNILPANTPVIIKTSAVPGGPVNVDLAEYIESTEDVVVPANDLSGTDVDITAPENCYILTYGQNGLGFYRYAKGKPLSAHKVYLTYQHGNSEARALRMVFADEETGIEDINDDPSTSSGQAKNIYSISGVRLNKLQKGINIVNGKKIVVK